MRSGREMFNLALDSMNVHNILIRVRSVKRACGVTCYYYNFEQIKYQMWMNELYLYEVDLEH